MNAVRKANRNVILSVVMTLMLIAAMMPGMAFAAEGYGVTITGPTTATTNEVVTMEKEITTPNDEAVHVDWVILENGTTADATISLHNGKLTATTAGTVVVEARLIAGAAPTPGTGGGQGQPCDATPLATDTCEVEVSSAVQYGFQGEGGNTMMLKNPSAVSYVRTDTLSGLTRYNNRITAPVTATNNTITFGYTMSAGMNNYDDTVFNRYANDIGIYDQDGTTKLASVEYGGCENKIISITADVSDNTKFVNGGTYILRFGPSVCGNNSSKKLGCYIDFQFRLAR